jgi:hypothetical protein
MTKRNEAMTLRTTALAATIMMLAVPASAAPTSTYTSVAWDKCKQIMADEESGAVAFTCPGIAGLDVWAAEGDLRTFYSYGPDPRSRCVATQTMDSFNTAGPTMEWRLDGGRPYATIIRYRMDNGAGTQRNFLVVTTLSGGEYCHIGLVDGSVPDHNRIAREIADTYAATFNCRADRPHFITNQALDIKDVSSHFPCPGN